MDLLEPKKVNLEMEEVKLKAVLRKASSKELTLKILTTTEDDKDAKIIQAKVKPLRNSKIEVIQSLDGSPPQIPEEMRRPDHVLILDKEIWQNANGQLTCKVYPLGLISKMAEAGKWDVLWNRQWTDSLSLERKYYSLVGNEAAMTHWKEEILKRNGIVSGIEDDNVYDIVLLEEYVNDKRCILPLLEAMCLSKTLHDVKWLMNEMELTDTPGGSSQLCFLNWFRFFYAEGDVQVAGNMEKLGIAKVKQIESNVIVFEGGLYKDEELKEIRRQGCIILKNNWLSVVVNNLLSPPDPIPYVVQRLPLPPPETQSSLDGYAIRLSIPGGPEREKAIQLMKRLKVSKIIEHSSEEQEDFELVPIIQPQSSQDLQARLQRTSVLLERLVAKKSGKLEKWETPLQVQDDEFRRMVERKIFFVMVSDPVTARIVKCLIYSMGGILHKLEKIDDAATQLLGNVYFIWDEKSVVDSARRNFEKGFKMYKTTMFTDYGGSGTVNAEDYEIKKMPTSKKRKVTSSSGQKSSAPKKDRIGEKLAGRVEMDHSFSMKRRNCMEGFVRVVSDSLMAQSTQKMLPIELELVCRDKTLLDNIAFKIGAYSTNNHVDPRGQLSLISGVFKTGNEGKIVNALKNALNQMGINYVITGAVKDSTDLFFWLKQQGVESPRQVACITMGAGSGHGSFTVYAEVIDIIAEMTLLPIQTMSYGAIIYCKGEVGSTTCVCRDQEIRDLQINVCHDARTETVLEPAIKIVRGNEGWVFSYQTENMEYVQHGKETNVNQANFESVCVAYRVTVGKASPHPNVFCKEHVDKEKVKTEFKLAVNRCSIKCCDDKCKNQATVLVLYV